MSDPALQTSPGQPNGRSALLGSYAPAPGAYDELLAADGSLRGHWRGFFDGFAAMSAAERASAVAMAQRLMRENNVTYVAQGDPQQTNRPWRLDLFPLLIDEPEWRALEDGLVQRARLLNSVLADLYGPQRLLADGSIPAALVYGSPQFLRPCHGIAVPGDIHLHFLAFDLARGSDGQWWVLSHRTQAPSGAGYALENRIVASHCLPDLFAASNVQRLASFFRAFSENLLTLARHDEPLAVMLSPGPHQETYFEHEYLARYLGYGVVEGSDLTVRDDRLYLKTVEGLKLVDLVVRRVDSELCDPLELRTDSLAGVPGLVQAARAGQVVIANALGSGLVENEGLMSFLPGLCRALLGEELKIPSVATWWCGQPAERAYVQQNLERLILRKVFAPKTMLAPDSDSIAGPALSPADRGALAQHIDRRGFEYIGQEIVSLSTTPVWPDGGGLQPGPMTLRVYLTATADGYRVMPGGLTRVSTSEDPRASWMHAGDFSKDTWVLWRGPVDTYTMLPTAPHALRLRRSGRDLPSRAADNLFWLGRYAERTEGAVRLLRSLVIRFSGEAAANADPVALERLVSLLVIQEHLSTRRAKRAIEGGTQAVEAELWTILFDPDCPDGLAKVLGNVRRNADLVRERLSLDTWQILKDMTEVAQRWNLNPGQEIDDAQRLLNRLIQHLAALNGMVMENMTRGYGWRFLDMGRRLERVRHIGKLVRDLTARGDPEADGTLALLLELADSTMTYRTRYKSAPQLPGVFDLLLADDSNPRSLMFQLLAVEDHMAVLPKEDDDLVITPAQRILTRLITDLRLADMATLAERNPRRNLRVGLDRLMREVDAEVGALSDLVARTYFSHSMPQRTSGPIWIEAIP